MVETISVTIPHETVNDESVRILSWHVTSGATVPKDQLLCEVETSKAIMEIHAPDAGVIRFVSAVGDEVPVGAVICEILPVGQQPQAQTLVAPKVDVPVAAPTVSEPPRFTPLARKMASEYGLAESVFPPGTLVRSADVLRKAGKLPPETEPRREVSTLNGHKAAKETGPVENIPVAGAPVDWSDLPRRKIVEGRILGKGQASTIQSSVSMICRATKLRARVERLGLSSVGTTALIVFEVSRILHKYPMFNALYDRGRVGQYRDINIGWAVDGGEGLVVPVIKQADQKSLREIAGIMQQHIEDYVSNSLDPSAFLGGTFTISDLSAMGIGYFQPLISQGQSAILGIGSELSADGGEQPLYLTLAFDHQLAEGRGAAQLLKELTRRLEAHADLEAGEKQAVAHAAEGDLYCALCQRDIATLRMHNAMLVRSELPPGFVCSICLAG